MASTGTFLFDPNLASICDEAVERSGLDLQEITGDHIISIRRSAGFQIASWSNRGHRQWTFDAAARSFPCPSSTPIPMGWLVRSE